MSSWCTRRCCRCPCGKDIRRGCVTPNFGYQGTTRDGNPKALAKYANNQCFIRIICDIYGGCTKLTVFIYFGMRPSNNFLFSASHSAQVHLGFDNWSSGIQRCNLLPSGLAKEENGSAILAALATGTQNYFVSAGQHAVYICILCTSIQKIYENIRKWCHVYIFSWGKLEKTCDNSCLGVARLEASGCPSLRHMRHRVQLPCTSR